MEAIAKSTNLILSYDHENAASFVVRPTVVNKDLLDSS